MRYRYDRIGQACFSVEIGRYQTFGMECREESAQSPLVAVMPDVSTDGVFVALLATRFTLQQLSPVHLIDAILDAIE